jgi:hypothetical protein
MIFTLSFGNVAQAKVPAWNLPWEGQGGVSGLNATVPPPWLLSHESAAYPEFILVFARQALQNPKLQLFKNVQSYAF